MRRRYFSLMELLVVVAIIGVLAGLLVGAIGMLRASAKAKLTETDLNGLYLALEQFKFKFGDYPDRKGNYREDGKQAPLFPEKKRLSKGLIDRFVKEKMFVYEFAQMETEGEPPTLRDPYGHPYVVFIPDNNPENIVETDGTLKKLPHIAHQKSGFYIYSQGGQDTDEPNENCIYLKK